MAMTWHELLFMHWPVDAGALREFIPPSLEIDLFDGAAWLGIVPFRMTGVRHRWLPALPGLSAFPELNVRTYVRARDGRAGVWFFSLDAPHRLAVRVARATFNLPYMDAAMSSRREGQWTVYECRRTGPKSALAFGRARTTEARFNGSYRGVGPALRSAAGSIESFLTDRYCLYSWGRGTLRRGEIDHGPWPLQAAEARIECNTMAGALGLSPAAWGDPLLHYAAKLQVIAWMPRCVG